MALALESLGLVLPNRMHERVIYTESFAHGKTAFEIDPKGIASQELAAIWSGVKESNSRKREITQDRKREIKKHRNRERKNSRMTMPPS